jgi:inner membrane protease subunit 2
MLTPRVLRQSASFGFFFFCAGLFVRDNFVCKDTVNGSSMAPTLSPYAHETGAKDSIIIRRDVRWSPKGIQRGDVVTFWKPHRPEEISVKRVIAVAGDVVYPWRGYALDPEVVHGERIGGGWDGLGTKDVDAVGGDVVELGKVTVPEGHVWVEGDNWRQSFDSLDFGPISLGLVDGKAVGIWREWFRIRGVEDGRDTKRREASRVVHGRVKSPVYSGLGV